MSWLLFAVLRGRLHPVGGLGVALGITVLLSIIALLLIAITHDYLPWRRLPNGHEEAPLTLTDRDATIDQDSTTGADAVGDQAIRDGRGSDHSVGQPGP
ncbi:conserved integral membrane protein [Mycobacteroides abscessus subsp. abscessus]|nr:conserved integral membrane protein [Mycobacteroides abscessus subsp. abscessus]